MPKDDPVLIDTSAWIDYLSGKNPSLETTVDLLLENDRVSTAAVILAELTQGARSEKEIQLLRNHLRPVHWIVSTDRHWEEAGHLSYRLGRLGKGVNLTDCYIACLAQGASSQILSLDKHFSWIADANGCRLFKPY